VVEAQCVCNEKDAGSVVVLVRAGNVWAMSLVMGWWVQMNGEKVEKESRWREGKRYECLGEGWAASLR
jgi:hypothetical protein